jgi:hypothetical protein
MPVFNNFLMTRLLFLCTGVAFGRFNGQFAFYLSLIPMTLLLLALYVFPPPPCGRRPLCPRATSLMTGLVRM